MVAWLVLGVSAFAQSLGGSKEDFRVLALVCVCVGGMLAQRPGGTAVALAPWNPQPQVRASQTLALVPGFGGGDSEVGPGAPPSLPLGGPGQGADSCGGVSGTRERSPSCACACAGEARGPPPPRGGAPGTLPGPGRGRGGRSDAAGRGSRGAGGRADREKGRGHGPALRLQRVRPPLEPEAWAGGARGSDPRPGRPRMSRLRGGLRQARGERAGGPRARQGTRGRGDAGAQSEVGTAGPLARPLGEGWRCARRGSREPVAEPWP